MLSIQLLQVDKQFDFHEQEVVSPDVETKDILELLGS